MKRKVYIETSIVSYLAARPSSDPFVRMRQLLTQEWWASRSDGRFDLFVSWPVFAGFLLPEQLMTH
ncbi:hypothetical protein F183_A10150 [Bryobacterales bacterium F-183]|nr:hypothetical protein F183_A10150 [Bryobacterales bacterium F-183]